MILTAAAPIAQCIIDRAFRGIVLEERFLAET